MTEHVKKKKDKIKKPSAIRNILLFCFCSSQLVYSPSPTTCHIQKSRWHHSNKIEMDECVLTFLCLMTTIFMILIWKCKNYTRIQGSIKCVMGNGLTNVLPLLQQMQIPLRFHKPTVLILMALRLATVWEKRISFCSKQQEPYAFIYDYAHTTGKSMQQKRTPVCIANSYSQGALEKFTGTWGWGSVEHIWKKNI